MYFDIVMFETMQHFFKSIAVVVNNEQTSLATKIDVIVANYIDMLIANPNIPLFLLNELKMQPDELVKKMGMREVLMNSSFIKQFQQGVKDGKITPIHPLHFFVNIISITVFPFVASPIRKGMGDLSQQQFEALMQERKTLIPKWINASLKAK